MASLRHHRRSSAALLATAITATALWASNAAATGDVAVGHNMSLSHYDTVGGQWAQDANGLVLTDPAPSRQPGLNGNLAITNDVQRGDYTLAVTAYSTEASSGSSDFSLIFGYTGPSDYYFAGFGQTNDFSAHGLFKVTGDAVTQVADFPGQIVPFREYRAEVRRVGTTAYVLLNGKPLAALSGVSSAPTKLGIGSQDDGARFADWTLEMSAEAPAVVTPITAAPVIKAPPTSVSSKPVTECSSVSQYGVTFVFQTSYQCGQFANGDYWVAPDAGRSGVTVTRITPDFDGGRNGWMANPDSGAMAYDSRLSGYSPDLVPSLPYTATDTTSIVKGVSTAGKCGQTSGHPPCLSTAVVLTVLPQPPAAGAKTFRPPYFGTHKPLFTTDQIRTDKLPNLPPVSAAPTLTEVQRRFERVQLDHSNSWQGRYLHAAQNFRGASADVSEYGSEIASDNADAALRLMLNDSLEAKKPALINYLQAGIDWYGVRKGEIKFSPDGGHKLGRKLPTTFAAVLLDDADMKSVVGDLSWGDDAQVYYSPAAGRVLWGRKCSDGVYEKEQAGGGGSRDCRDPIGMIDGGDTPGGAYQKCCTSMPMKGYSLAARLLPDGRATWNDDDVHAYVDRWVSFGTWASPDPQRRYLDRHGEGADTGHYRSTFQDNMWDRYRPTIKP